MSCSTQKDTQFSPKSQNEGLVIHYLTAGDMTAIDQVKPSSGIEVFCTATAQNGGSLNYHWSVSDGEIIEEEGDRILWFSPQHEGVNTITVSVDDGRGNNAVKSLDIEVTNAPPTTPMVISMRCMDCENGIEASRWMTYELRCEADDPDSSILHYTWFATIGKIEGNGPTVNWITMGQYGNALITVIVSDDDGNRAKGYLAVNISCCH